MCRCNSSVTLEEWCPRSWEADPHFQKPLSVTDRLCCSDNTRGVWAGAQSHSLSWGSQHIQHSRMQDSHPLCLSVGTERLCSHKQLWARGCLTFCFLLPLPALYCSTLWAHGALHHWDCRPGTHLWVPMNSFLLLGMSCRLILRRNVDHILPWYLLAM